MSTENQGGDPVAAARAVDQQDEAAKTVDTPPATARAVAKAVGLQSFEDHSQSFAGALSAQAERDRRIRAAIAERRVDVTNTHQRRVAMAKSIYDAAVSELDKEWDKLIAEIDEEERDLNRVSAGIQAALAALQGS